MKKLHYFKISYHAFLLIALFFAGTRPVFATKLTISVDELARSIPSHSSTDQMLTNILGNAIAHKLARAKISIDKSHLNYTQYLPDHHVKNKCSKSVVLKNLLARFEIAKQSHAAFGALSWNKPLVGEFEIEGNIFIIADSDISLGIKALGKCVSYVNVAPRIHVSSPFKLHVAVHVDLNPHFFLDKTQSEAFVQISPRARLTASLERWRPRVDMDDVQIHALGGYIKSSLVDYLEKLINRDFNPQQELLKRIQLAEDKVNVKIKAALGDTDIISIAIPRIPAKRLDDLHSFLSGHQYFSFPLTREYLQRNQFELSYALLTADKKALRKITSAAMACESVSLLSDPVPVINGLHHLQAGQCVPTNTQKGQVYGDSQCTLPIIFPGYLDFCQERADQNLLGNAMHVASVEKQGWTYSHGSRFSMGIEAQETSHTFYQRAEYKSVRAGEQSGKVYIFNNEQYENDILDCIKQKIKAKVDKQDALKQCAENFETKTTNYRQIYTADGTQKVLDYYLYTNDLYKCIKRRTRALVPWKDTKNACQITVDEEKYQITIDDDKQTQAAARLENNHAFYNCYAKALSGFALMPKSDERIRLNCSLGSALNPQKVNIESPVIKGEGVCRLEMRVYRNKAMQPNGRAVVAFHGGAWKWRKFGFLGLESEITKWVNNGFTVFTPFTRVVGEEDANSECQNADIKGVLTDVVDAVNWIYDNRHKYDIDLDKLTLFGHSSGGFNALFAATQTPELFDKMILVYPATDISLLLKKLKTKESQFEPMAVKALRDIIPKAFNDLFTQQSDEAVAWLAPLNNVATVSNSPKKFPPVYIIHGKNDKWVPASQSIALCNAYNKKSNQIHTPAVAGQYTCGLSGQLILIPDTGHMLDVCLPGVSCLTKDEHVQLMVKEALQSAREWALHQ